MANALAARIEHPVWPTISWHRYRRRFLRMTLLHPYEFRLRLADLAGGAAVINGITDPSQVTDAMCSAFREVLQLPPDDPNYPEHLREGHANTTNLGNPKQSWVRDRILALLSNCRDWFGDVVDATTVSGTPVPEKISVPEDPVPEIPVPNFLSTTLGTTDTRVGQRPASDLTRNTSILTGEQRKPKDRKPASAGG